MLNSESNINKRPLNIIIVISLIVLAVLIRAPGLGEWCLTDDEFYFSKSVSFILDKWIPEFPNGGYYTRGIALQYLMVIPAIIFQDWEFAVRLLPLIFGVMTIPLFYFVCRFFMPMLPSVLCATILLLSSWHIEFSRFCRMYSAFQFIFIMFVYFFYSGFWLKNRFHKKIAWALAFISIFFYEGSILIAFLLLLAMFLEDSPINRNNFKLFAVVAILLVVNYLVNGIGYRFWGVENIYPQEMPLIVGGGSLPLLLPRFDLIFVCWKSLLPLFMYCVFVGWGFYILIKKIYQKQDLWLLIMIGLSVILPLMHLFGLLLACFIVFLLAREKSFYCWIKDLRCCIPYICTLLFFWFILGFTYSDIWLRDADVFTVLSKIVSYLFHYPRINDAFILPFIEDVPIFTIVSLSVILISFICHLFIYSLQTVRFPLLALFSLIMLISIFKTSYGSTRYSFFFFPIIFVIVFVFFVNLRDFIEKYFTKKSIKIISKSIIFVPVIIFFFTEEINLNHIVNVSSKEANFRLGKYEKLSDHWYERKDYESPAIFVNNIFNAGDVILTDSISSSFYLRKPFVTFISINIARFRNQSRKSGKEELWTGRPLIYNPHDLVNLVPIDTQRSLFVITIKSKRSNAEYLYNLIDQNFLEDTNLKKRILFVSLDRRVEVWKITRSL